MNKKFIFLTLIGLSFALYATLLVVGQDASTAPATTAPAVSASMGAVTKPAIMAADTAVRQAETAAATTQPVVPASEMPVVAPLTTPTNPPVATATEETGYSEIKEDTGEIPGVKSQITDNKISVNFDDMEMKDVIRLFTRFSAANIIVDPTNLHGRVTVNLNNVEWQPALVSILSMHGLSLEEQSPGSSVYSIIPRPAVEPMQVKTFLLKYATVSNITSVIQGMLGGGGGIQTFPSRNALVVRSTARNLSEIEKVIKDIDILRDQVFIEAKFLELNDSAIKDLGINWQVLQGFGAGVGGLQWNASENRDWVQNHVDTKNQTDNRSKTDTVQKRYDMDNVQYEETSTTYSESPPGSGVYVPIVTRTPTRTVQDDINQTKDITESISDSFTKTIADMKTAVLSVDDFRLVLSALKQIDGVAIVSNPKLIVANEEPALIHIGSVERPFISSVTPASQSSGAIVSYTPGQEVEYGVKLTVTPTINTESNITVRMEPELTRKIGEDTAPNGQTYPRKSTKKIKTVFCLESGKTVAIGGLTETTDGDSVNKIPLLGDIPLIGKYIFSSTHEERAQTETIIFVTVGIAKPETILREDGLPEATELTQRRLLEKDIKRHQFQAELEKERKDGDKKIKKADRVKSQLIAN